MQLIQLISRIIYIKALPILLMNLAEGSLPKCLIDISVI
jgi:hypothetical protein